MSDNYDDIINLPHHISQTRKRMTTYDRAAQFSSFAALVGFGDEVKETARLTDERFEPDEYMAQRIDTCLQILIDNAEERPAVSLTLFVSDEKKSGGAYETVAGNFRRFDESDGTVVLAGGRKIHLADICSIDGEIFGMFGEM